MTKFRERYFWFDGTSDLPDDREIIVDCFAGGGGASKGIEWGCGFAPDLAINHDQAAIAMHVANNPKTVHRCENLWDEEPDKVTEGKPIGAAWFSPDCTHHSKAKGSKPRKKEIRALSWIVLRWAVRVRPRVLFLENVEEFIDWGPLDEKDQPIKARKGELFRAFVDCLEGGIDPEAFPDAAGEIREFLGDDADDCFRGLGYNVEWQDLVASDYGAPTTRKRVFLIARCDGEPIVWPKPTHGSPKVIAKLTKRGGCNLKKWRTAAEIIDWTLPCPSIFDTAEEIKAKYGLRAQRPLAEKTQKRIAEGIRRYVIDTPEPFIVQVNHGGDAFRGQSLNEPIPTLTQKHGYAVVSPFISSSAYTKSTGRGKYIYSPHEPIRTITASNDKIVITPTLVQTGYGERPGQRPRCLDLQSPLGTVVSGGGKHAIVTPYVTALQQTAFLNSYYGPRPGDGGHRGRTLNEPLATQTTENRHSLVTAFLAKHYGGVVGIPANRPFPTITHRGTQNQIVAAHVTRMNFGQKPFSSCDEPLRTITAQGTHFAEVRAFLMKFYGSGGQWNSVGDPVPTVTVKERLALGMVLIQGEAYQIVDIGMRMLTPRELFRAQGFPEDYVIDVGLNGKPATKSEQVGRCGNSVSPYPAAAIVKANFTPKPVTQGVVA